MIKKFNQLTDVMCLLLQARPRPRRLVRCLRSSILFLSLLLY
jgi:hypothetical protein